ncbi:hydroxyacylglutathione hydrolase [Shewanella aestuarii]|uniref:Hydroxyacylglutathione hydrolase n=1 Tax=Shewanella aestuarii TaxID=1028752 RepID=A0A6G9QKG4_9GAMM|nr:hydroxyacylglutathione hydrolase [Shewanella aestuarii]QIR14555.1 hydroxyacylglutathione hydrolase [Shewanella aestuarii]
MIQIHTIPAFTDNYIWLIRPTNRAAIVVDPGCAKSVISYLEQHEIQLAAILVTHHHNDHTGGIELLQQHYNNTLAVYGPGNENISGITVPIVLSEHSQMTLNIAELDSSIRVISVPGHTSGHLAYLIDGNLFCGDTLFSGGCGRLFEGTAEQMAKSLSLLAALPKETKVYCAHEYTEANLAFAKVVMPDNVALSSYQKKVISLRKLNQATIPSTIETESQINPFLRCETTEVQLQLSSHFNQIISNEIQAFTLLRQYKDNF